MSREINSGQISKPRAILLWWRGDRYNPMLVLTSTVNVRTQHCWISVFGGVTFPEDTDCWILKKNPEFPHDKLEAKFPGWFTYTVWAGGLRTAALTVRNSAPLCGNTCI